MDYKISFHESDDSPRSEYGTPRDDRFFTPRTFAHGSSSDEWGTPRGKAGIGYTSQSDGEYKTPRTIAGTEQDDIFYSSRSSRESTPRHPLLKSSKSSVYYDSKEIGDDVEIAPGVTDQDVEDIFSYARHGRCEDIERLLNRGIPVDIRDSFGNTLLVIACQNGNKKVAKLVLRRGGNINAKNHKGNTPLHYCFHFGYGDTLGQYIISKVNLISVNICGRSSVNFIFNREPIPVFETIQVVHVGMVFELFIRVTFRSCVVTK